MKTIGLIGGTTWASTADYYKYINLLVNKKSGGKEYAMLILYSINFSDLQKLSSTGRWAEVSEMLCDISKKLESAGAECIMLGANTLHRFVDDIKRNVQIPLINIAEETAKEIVSKKLSKIGLLGTIYTMEWDFYKNVLAEYKIETIVPEKEDREFLQYTIFNELGKEIFLPETKARYLEIIDKLTKQGAEGIVLGCTEIPLIIKQEDCNVPVFDTTIIHSNAAAEFALG
jgi:aspartate racemase